MSSEGGVLVGRTDEMRKLAALLDDVDARGRAIGMVGAPGVGKSALQAAAIALAVDRGFTVLSAQGSEAETHLPFASLHQVLQPLLPQVERLPPRQAGCTARRLRHERRR